jgi:hypothetical protein
MSKPPPRRGAVDVNVDDGSGCGFCLLNTMLLCAAPTALVALVVKVARR